MSKPTNKPGWNSTNVSEPSSTKKSQGWAADEKPSAAQINWLLKTISQWIDHVDLDQVKGETGDAGPVGSKGLTGDAGPVGLKGSVGDQGPQGPAGSGSLSASDEARLANLENIANISSPATVSAGIPYSGQALNETLSASSTIDWSVSLSQRIVLSGNSTLSFANGVSGKVYFLSVQQPSGGSATVTWPGNVSWDSGSAPVLSTGGNRKDIFGFYFNGSNYIGYAVSGFQNIPVLNGSETINGYIAGGCSGGSVNSAVNDIQKINFNNDSVVFISNNDFGTGITSSGSITKESLASTSHLHYGFGTQSTIDGYRFRGVYSSLVAGGGNSTTVAGHKMNFTTNVSSIIRTSNTGVTSNDRRPTSQSSSAAFILGAVSPFSGKLTFATDVYSTPSTITSAALGTPNTAGAVSTATTGIYFTGGGSTNVVRPLTFSTEVVSSTTAAQSFTPFTSELVESSTTGYSQNSATTTSSGTSNCRKFDKSSYANSVLATTLSGVGGAAAATQGVTAGYFCGGQNYLTTNYSSIAGATTAGSTSVKKIIFASEIYSIHSASLKTSCILAAGFEG